ncbi:Transcription factor [Haplosporangium sp. Z 767]|nr:Transcription factor [Haplosporangium sp. Z 767]KAF9187960.1 Transcription factor [Haplosporangium sp. Z 11]
MWRPCQRCIKRNIGHLCHDEPKPSQLAASRAANANGNEARKTPQQDQQQKQQQVQLQNQQLQQQQQSLQTNNMNGLPMYGFNNQLAALPVTPLTFASEHMGNEFTVISDFLESLGGDQQNMFPDQGIPVNTTEKFFLTAANPSDGTNEDRLTQVINAKFEAGFLKPYNYVNGYSRLQKYMDSNMSNISRQRILNVMGTFRPAFRAVAQSLTDIDLVLVEEAFERLLLDYDRVFSSMGIPACLWRRTGEIYKGNKEFAALVNVPLEMLREGRLCIYELMAEESAVNYWEKYGNIAFDAGQKAVLTSCLLKNPDPESQNVISCCFSFTIRRDKYNIPTVIVGNFLPVSLG